jgi:hypothetical protein
MSGSTFDEISLKLRKGAGIGSIYNVKVIRLQAAEEKFLFKMSFKCYITS